MVKLVIDLPKEVAPYQHDLRRFVDAMVYKLKLNARKGRWDGMGVARALDLLQGEVRELTEAVEDGGNMIEILLESADVANFALILSNITVEKGNDHKNEPAGPVGEAAPGAADEGRKPPRAYIAVGARARDPEAERS